MRPEFIKYDSQRALQFSLVFEDFVQFSDFLEIKI